MPRLSDELYKLIMEHQGQTISLTFMRTELRIARESPGWDGLREAVSNFVTKKMLMPVGRKGAGDYKIIRQVQAIKVYGRERRPPYDFFFPKCFDTGMEFLFAEDIVVREGDMVLLSGQSNYGKTTLCLSICAENIHAHPVLMGNEYTTTDLEPSPRLLDRLDRMDWVSWYDLNGEDNFTLLPVHEDYVEHIVKDSINIIDWINLPGEYYLISPVMEGIKKAVGKGIAVIALQKNSDKEYGRGGAMTKDFADCELLLDSYGDSEVKLTIGKVKEAKRRVMGRMFAYSIEKGVKIINFREIVKCPACFGKGWKFQKPCDECVKLGYVDK